MQTIPSTMNDILKGKHFFGAKAPYVSVTLTPDIDDDSVTFAGTSAHALLHQNLSSSSLIVTTTSGGAYTVTADYSADYTNGTITRATSGTIPSTGAILADYTFTVTVQPSNTRVEYEHAAMGARCDVSWPNVSSSDPTDMGYYSPDRTSPRNNWHNAVLPGCDFTVTAGYTTSTGNHVRLFKGQIDEMSMSVEPDASMIGFEARDDSWRLLENTAGYSSEGYSITYTSTTVNQVVYDLLTRAGFSSSGLSIQTTPQTVIATTFVKETYADALEWCIEKTGYEMIIDRFGNVAFKYPTDRQPEAVDESITFAGTSAETMANNPIVTNSEVVTSTDSTGSTGYVTYTRNTDYTVDYSAGTITRATGGSISSGGTVLADYVYPAWVFKEGEDLFSLNYRITRRNVYGRIWVTGTSSGSSTGVYTYDGSTFFGIGENKVVFFDMPELGNSTELQDAADQLGNDMIRKNREVQFEAVANPWIDPGDCIQVVEARTTISEIYRILSLEYDYSTGGALMRGTAYYYGYAPL